MRKSVLFFALLACLWMGLDAFSARYNAFLERQPGASLLRRRHLSSQSNDDQADHSQPSDGQASHNDDPGSQDDSANYSGDSQNDSGHDSHDQNNDYPADQQDNGAEGDQNAEEPQSGNLDLDNAGAQMDSAFAGSPNAEPIELPKPPQSLEDVSEKLNTVTDKIQNLPGVGMIKNKDGVFGDLFADGPTVSDMEAAEDGNTDSGSEYITQGGDDELPPNVEQLLVIDLGDTGSLDKSYISISSDLKLYENTYIECMDKLSDLDFTPANINACVGVGQRYVSEDIEFFKRKILARADSIIRSRMVENCFKVAGMDLVLSSGCDLLQKDSIELLWSELNYYLLIDYHRAKYTFRQASLTDELIDPILAELKSLYSKQTDLMVELYNHRTLTIQRIRDYIADRVEYLRDMEDEHGPLQRAPLSANKIIKVDSISSKLQKLDDIRQAQPWVMFKQARKTQLTPSSAGAFHSPWSNPSHLDYGRGPLDRPISQPKLTAAGHAIQAKINAVL